MKKRPLEHHIPACHNMWVPHTTPLYLLTYTNGLESCQNYNFVKNGGGYWSLGVFHTGTNTGFPGSGSPIRIQCGPVWAPHYLKTMDIALLHWILSTVMQHSTQLGSRSRLWCEGKVVFGCGSPIRIRSGSKGPCGLLHEDYGHCTAGLDLKHCHAA